MMIHMYINLFFQLCFFFYLLILTTNITTTTTTTSTYTIVGSIAKQNNIRNHMK